jgi:hypothetical protein
VSVHWGLFGFRQGGALARRPVAGSVPEEGEVLLQGAGDAGEFGRGRGQRALVDALRQVGLPGTGSVGVVAGLDQAEAFVRDLLR